MSTREYDEIDRLITGIDIRIPDRLLRKLELIPVITDLKDRSPRAEFILPLAVFLLVAGFLVFSSFEIISPIINAGFDILMQEMAETSPVNKALLIGGLPLVATAVSFLIIYLSEKSDLSSVYRGSALLSR